MTPEADDGVELTEYTKNGLTIQLAAQNTGDTEASIRLPLFYYPCLLYTSYSTGGATSEFVGIAIDQVDKVFHCNASKFEIPGRIECGSLSVNGREI